MLVHLKVSNFALIEVLELSWHSGFTTITGETGAGKSIMLGALNHLLGQRADLKALKDDSQKCVIEGTFRLAAGQYASLFESLELDFEEESILRREILPSGKSRAFVNDSPVRLEQMQKLSNHLIDIHSQHDTLLLNDTAFQLELIDSFGQHQELIQDYQASYKEWKASSRRLKDLKDLSAQEGGDLDYLEFLYQELADAKLIPSEQEDIEQKLEVLEHKGKIESALSSIETLSQASSPGLDEMLRIVNSELKSVRHLNSQLEEFANRSEALLIEFEDLRQEIESYASNSQFDPLEKEKLDARLSQLIHLQRKHQVEDVNGLITKRDSLDERMSAAADREQAIKMEGEALESFHEEMVSKAKLLHEARKSLIPNLVGSIKQLLSELNMSNASFEIQLSSNTHYELRGNDQVSFLFSANPGQSPKPLNKVASGGELSRVMLSLKAILAKSRSLPTIIFDEIDTGVSGQTALKIGDILKEMGQYMQVISITHLAQIASKGIQHYLVKKESSADDTKTEIQVLSPSQRLEEVARLLGGDAPSDAALANARELIEQA